MSNAALLHPTDQALRDFSVGKLGDGLADSVNSHLQECADCQRRVAAMSSDSFLGRLRDAHLQPEISPPVQSESGAPRPDIGEASHRDPQTDTLPPHLADHPDYEILRELGRGGMGVVYLAHNRLMGRDEVLKVVGKHLIERKGVLERFSREIRSAARLTHPNIVHAYSAFRCGESVVFAMEYVDGLDLAKVVKAKGPMSVAHASYSAYQAALGLQHAHEQGMVHRDIKPGNLMLSYKGDKAVIKVLDFGLAKATRENPLDGALTHEGQMLGTPDFIAPEQIRDAQSAGIQADIYSLGCTLYYLLTGAAPFQGPSLYDLLQAHFSMDAQPLNLVRPEVPAELAALVAKMMAKDMNRRFQTPAEVAEALKPFFKKAGATAKPEVSMLADPGPGRENVQAVRQTTETAKKTPRQASRPAESTSSSSGLQLQTGGELTESDGSGGAPQAAPALGAGSRPPWKSLPVIAAAGAFSLVMLGIIIIIITKNGRVTIATEKGNTTVTIDHTVGASGGSTAAAGEAGVSQVGELPVSPAIPSPGTETVAAAPGSGSAGPVAGSGSAGEPVAKPAADRRADAITEPLPPGVRPAPVVTKSIGMKLALIPSGKFVMGSRVDDKEAYNTEKPQHNVRISRPFYLGIYEVTQSQYEAVMGTNSISLTSTGQHPVTFVSWLDAVRFCNALSAREALTPYYDVNGDKVTIPARNGLGYRLPTEAEWEYACRAETETKYSFGDDPSLMDSYGWHHDNSGGIHPVGQKRPNAFGLYDMHGNVEEWCSDAFDGNYYERAPPVDPFLHSGTFGSVTRGGSADLDPRCCRSAYRGFGDHLWQIGFRVARGQSPGIKNLAISAQSGMSLSKESTPIQRSGEAKQQVSRTVRPNSKVAPKLRADWSSPTTKMAFVRIRGGEFNMGSPDDDKEAFNTERPPHLVRISAFYLGVIEVTQAQYEDVMGSNPSYFSSTGTGKDKVAGKSTDQYPVEQVSLFDAIRFCNALSKKDGLTPYYHVNGETVEIPDRNGPGYRLPTEAEWEYACRGGKTTKYSFGNEPSALGECGWFGLNSTGSSHPVADKRPNDFGLYDMHGNVCEWCSDGWDAHYYKLTPDDDPPGAGGATSRVFRGGGWDSEPRECRSANRYRFAPGNMSYFLGFRVARTQAVIDTGLNAPLPPTQPAVGEHANEFRPLFNGKDRTGWTVDGGSAESWRVEGGELVVTGPGDFRKLSYLLTEENFADFLLRFEWQSSPGTESAVALRAVPGEKFNNLLSPLRVKIYDTLIPEALPGRVAWTTGGLPQDMLLLSAPPQLRPFGSWNLMGIELSGRILRVWINDREVLRTNLAELAKSPEALPGVTRRSGRIGFQSHTGTMRFRNIEIKKLPEAQSRSRAAGTAKVPAGEAGDSGVGKPPVPSATPPPGTEAVTAASGKKVARPLVKGSPEWLLKERGLTRSGAYFVVASEHELLESVQKTQPLINQMAQAYAEYEMVLRNEMLLRTEEEYRADLTTQIDAANATLSSMPNGARANSSQNEAYQLTRGDRDVLNRAREATDRDIEALRSQQVPAGRKDELAKTFETKRLEFFKASDELRPIYEKAMGEYRKLQSDPSVKDALGAYGRSTKTAAFLGPSKDFKSGQEKIKLAKRLYQPETPPTKKKGRPAKR